MTMDETPILRVESRFKNARLYNAIAEASPQTSDNRRLIGLRRAGPIKAFCDLHEINSGDVYRLLNLKLSPIRRTINGQPAYKPICIKLSALLDADVRFLFPPKLYRHEWPSLAVELSDTQTVSLSAALGSPVLELPAPQDDIIEHDELKRAMVAALDTLTPRERRLITLRFGLDNHDEHTLGEIAEDFGISKGRAQQIEVKALSKLRWPSRAKALKPFWNPQLLPTVEDVQRQRRKEAREALAEARRVLAAIESVR